MARSLFKRRHEPLRASRTTSQSSRYRPVATASSMKAFRPRSAGSDLITLEADKSLSHNRLLHLSLLPERLSRTQ